MPGENRTIDFKDLKNIEGKVEDYSEEQFSWIVKNFAKPSIENKEGFYGREYGQHSIKRNINQSAGGKICEVAVYTILSKFGCTEPNFDIYPPGSAHFDPDLICNNFNIHVKSCELTSTYGIGFTFQYKKHKTIDKIFNHWSDNDIVICCLLHRLNRTIYIYDVEKWDIVKSQLNYTDGFDKSDLKDCKLFYKPVKTGNKFYDLQYYC